MSLSAAQRARFQADGYLHLPGLFPSTRMDALRTELDGLHNRVARAKPSSVQVAWEPDCPEPRIRQLMHSERISESIDAMSREPQVLAILQELIGPDIVLFHSKLMMKAAGDGSFTPWHQDWSYWHAQHQQASHVNVMVAIDAADEANGAIRFVRGSHHQGPLNHQHLQTSSFSIGLPGDLDAYEADMICMQPGDAVIFGALVVHGSGPNHSTRPRRANTFAFDRLGNHKVGFGDERLRLRQGQLINA